MPTHDVKTCPFCDSAIATLTWLQTARFRVIYNIAPIVPGHSLVVPKQHISSLLDLDDSDMCELFQTARRAIDILLGVFGGEGFDLSLQDGVAAGQTVSHLHVHIMPRKPGDLPADTDWHQQILDSESRPRLAERRLRATVLRLRRAAYSCAGLE